jgi:adenosine deaminase
MTAGAQTIANDISQATTKYYQEAQQIMSCNTAQAQIGCNVKVRFQISAMRNADPQIVFTQLVISFLVATENPLVASVNIVGPENAYYSGRDYELHMQMIKFLHAQYPKVHLSLHAGELSILEVPPEFMQDHITKAIDIAGAERIGHAADIIAETNASHTLQEMAQRHIVAELCLTSNERALGVVGPTHPLPLYMHYHVPIMISTDDEGIFRSTLSQEYWLAVTRYNLSYHDVKTFARNVPTYSFLAGESLWSDPDKFKPVVECKTDKLGSDHPSALCAAFLKHSEKAQQQWLLEKQFKAFETSVVERLNN